MVASAETCHVSIRTVDADVDVTLPSYIPIAELMPAVVDLVGTVPSAGSCLHLARVSGEPLDPAATIAHYGIADGELLVLTAAAPAPASPPRFDTSTAVLEATAALQAARLITGRRAGRIVTCWCAAVGMVLVGHATLEANTTRPPAGTAGCAIFLLAMSAIAATSLLTWRLLRCAPLVLFPIAAVAMTAAAAAVGAVGRWWSTAAVGPMLTTISLATLAGSTFLTVRSSGLATAELPDSELQARATAARHRLLLLVITAVSAAALGTVVTAATTQRPAIAAAFIAVVAATLILRAARTPDPYSFVVLLVSSGIATTTVVLLCSVTLPSSTWWLCAGLVAVGAGGLRPCRLPAGARRAIAVLDFVVGAAVVPLAAAAAGAFPTLPVIGQP